MGPQPLACGHVLVAAQSAEYGEHACELGIGNLDCLLDLPQDSALTHWQAHHDLRHGVFLCFGPRVTHLLLRWRPAQPGPMPHTLWRLSPRPGLPQLPGRLPGTALRDTSGPAASTSRSMRAARCQASP